MKKILLMSLAFIFMGFYSCGQNIDNASLSKKINLKGVRGVNVSSSFELFITQGNEESVTISAASKELLEKIEVKIENGELIIRFKHHKFYWKEWNSDRLKLKAFVNLKSLETVTASSASDVYFEEGFTEDDVAINLSGASSLKGKLTAKKVTAIISGASDMSLEGIVANLQVEASGASDFKGYNLAADYCTAKTSGASSININVTKELNATASGASSIKYRGGGIIRDVRISGASNISRKS